MAPLTVSADGAQLYLIPERGTYQIGDTFEVKVVTDTDSAWANAAEAELRFDPAVLQVVKITTDSSVLNSWPTLPTYSNAEGRIKFSGTAATNFSGIDRELLTVRFSARSVSTATLQYESGALLSMNGRTSNLITAMRSGVYTVNPERLPANPATESVDIATSTEPVPLVAGASLQVPELTAYDARISEGDRILLKGITSPHTNVAIVTQYGDEVPVQSMVLANGKGDFTYVSEEPVSEGVYHAWAEVRSADGKDSFSSDRVLITVKSDGFTAFVRALIPLLYALMPFLLLLGVVGFSAGFLITVRRSRNSSR